MKTRAGTKLTKEEIRLVRRLKRLAKDWKETPNRLWLWSGADSLHVMVYGGTKTNPVPHTREGPKGGMNPDNMVEGGDYISIPNDGGDW